MPGRQHHRVPRPDVVVAIDGPSGSGKSSVSRTVATTLGLRYLDTGAMYRAVTWEVLRQAALPTVADPAAAGAVAELVIASGLEIDTDPAAPAVRVHGEALGDRIRSVEVTAAVSAVSAVPQVRSLLVAQQRRLAAGGGIVVEGRDIGSVVLPAAHVKVFLTASDHARARRRGAQHRAGPLSDAEIERVRADHDRRDRLDSSRTVSPLIRADGAHELDTTALSFEQVVEAVISLIMLAES